MRCVVRRAFCTATIAEALKLEVSPQHKIKGLLRPAQVPRVAYRHRLTHLRHPSHARSISSANLSHNQHKIRLPGSCPSIPDSYGSHRGTNDWAYPACVGRAVTGFVFLVLIGLWDRYEQEITAGLSRIYERYLAWQAGFFRRRADTDVPAAAEAGRNRRGGKHQPRHVRCVVRGRQHRHRGWTRPQQR